MPDEVLKHKRGRRPGFRPPPREWPLQMLEAAWQFLLDGKIRATEIYAHTGFPSEHACRTAMSRYLFNGDPKYTWIQMSAYAAVRRMQESPEDAASIPTVLCGDCPLFKPDERMTRKGDGRMIRYGTCTECGQRKERCSSCVYGIYDKADEDLIAKKGRHYGSNLQ